MGNLRHPRFVLFLAVLIAGTAVTAWFLGAAMGLVLGFDLASLVFLASTLPLWLDDHPDAVRARSERDDGGRVLLVCVSLAALVAVMLALARLIGGRDANDIASFMLILATLVLAWLFVNLTFTLHYSHLYYDQNDGKDAGGLDFPGPQPPIFADFCYFSFVVGMTSQVSDIPVTDRRMRRVVLMQGLFAFFFNLGVLALTINVISGML